AFYVGMLGGAYAAAGRRSEAEALLAELQERSDHAYVAPHHKAFIEIPLGRVDDAFADLERAIADRNCLIGRLSGCPSFDPIRGDARFPALLAKLPEG